jgi:hypothetical protein
VLMVAGFLFVTNVTNVTNTRTVNEAPHIWEVPTPSDDPHGASAKSTQERGQSQAALEVDVTKLGLQRRSEVLKLLGHPLESSPNGIDNYSWGFAGYTDGKLDQIDYVFKTGAASTAAALAKVGLKQTSNPKKGSLSYYWNSPTGSLTCCGFEMDNVVIPANLSGISVGFKRQLTGALSEEPQQTTPKESVKERTKGTISLSQIVANVNKATMAQSGMKFIVNYEDGPFAVIEVNPPLWEALSPPQQRAMGTNFATLFGATGGINCRVKVYGVEVGHVSTSILGGWQYETR